MCIRIMGSVSLWAICAPFSSYVSVAGGYSILERDTFSTIGDIISTVKGVQYCGGYHQYCGGCSVLLGYHQYCGGYT